MSAYLSLIGRSRGWALINFFCLWDGRLFEVGTNSRLGAYSNKYGTFSEVFVIVVSCCPNTGHSSGFAG